MALILSRKSGEAFYVDSTRIVVEVKHGRVRAIIQADKSVRVLREELKGKAA